jgi:hypothetical protein
MSSKLEFISHAIDVINQKLDMSNILQYDYFYNFEKDGWYYYLYKSIKYNEKILFPKLTF